MLPRIRHHVRALPFSFPTLPPKMTVTATLTRSYSRTAPPILAKRIPPSEESNISKCIWTLASAFEVVPCTNAFSAESGQTVLSYIDRTIRDSIAHNGVILEAANSSAVALWELPPSDDAHEASSPGSTSGGRGGPVKQEWNQFVRSAKMRYIGVEKRALSDGSGGTTLVIRPHYHLDFLARNPHVPKVQGAISAVVHPYLALAEQEHLSVWLEATSLDVIPLYEHFGFRIVEEIVVGAGRVNGEGRLREGGEGVKAWLMLLDNNELS